jgi:hypothetical protein
MSNIYSAPSARLDHVDTDNARQFKKPKAVLVLQLWSLVLMAFVAVAFMKNLHNIDGRAYGVILGMSGRTRIYILVGIIVALLLMLHGLDRRSLLGRALGLFFIFITAAPVYVQFFMPIFRDNIVMELLRYGIIVLMCLPFVYWGFALSFSERARGYFAQEPD